MIMIEQKSLTTSAINIKKTASVLFVLNTNQLERCFVSITSPQAKKKKTK